MAFSGSSSERNVSSSTTYTATSMSRMTAGSLSWMTRLASMPSAVSPPTTACSGPVRVRVSSCTRSSSVRAASPAARSSMITSRTVLRSSVAAKWRTVSRASAGSRPRTEPLSAAKGLSGEAARSVLTAESTRTTCGSFRSRSLSPTTCAAWSVSPSGRSAETTTWMGEVWPTPNASCTWS